VKQIILGLAEIHVNRVKSRNLNLLVWVILMGGFVVEQLLLAARWMVLIVCLQEVVMNLGLFIVQVVHRDMNVADQGFDF
jgi:hypothetical protein